MNKDTYEVNDCKNVLDGRTNRQRHLLSLKCFTEGGKNKQKGYGKITSK